MGPLWDYLSQQADSRNPLELAGFDCQFTGTASQDYLADDIEAYIASLEIDAIDEEQLYGFLKQIRNLAMHSNAGGDKDQFIQTLEQIRGAISRIPESDSSHRMNRFWQQLFQSLGAYADYKWTKNDSNSASDAMKRDAQMARNLIWQADEYYADRKIIVWAASFHIMRNPADIEVPDGSVDYSNMVQMGQRVHQSLGQRVYTIGFTAHQGRAGSCFGQSWSLDPSPGGTFESICSEAGLENALIPLNTDTSPNWLNEKRLARPLGYTWMKARWGQHFDAIVFNKTMTPSTR